MNNMNRNIMKNTPLSICKMYEHILLEKTPLVRDVVRVIVHSSGNAFLTAQTFQEQYQSELKSEIEYRLQHMINIFEEWRVSRRIDERMMSVLEPCALYNECYYSPIFLDPLRHLGVGCSIERDRCEIPILISPPLYNFPHAHITYVFNELIRELKKENCMTTTLIWKEFLSELYKIITYMYEEDNTYDRDIEILSFVHSFSFSQLKR